MSVVVSAEAERKQPFLPDRLQNPSNSQEERSRIARPRSLMPQSQLCFPSTEPVSCHTPLSQVFGVLPPWPCPKPYREAQWSELQGKTQLHCINQAVNKGVQQGNGGKTSDSLKVPLGEAHRAQLSTYALFCKSGRVESNSCSTTSYVTLQIFHFSSRRLKNIKKSPNHANI